MDLVTDKLEWLMAAEVAESLPRIVRHTSRTRLGHAPQEQKHITAHEMRYSKDQKALSHTSNGNTADAEHCTLWAQGVVATQTRIAAYLSRTRAQYSAMPVLGSVTKRVNS